VSPSLPPPRAEPEERRTSPVELLWDLVFVFAVTQVTTLLAHETSWARFGQAMLVLALVWWAWSAFVWAANAQPERSRTLQAVLLAGMVLVFLVGLSVPRAFGPESLLFAASYAAVRLLHLAVYADAARHGNAGAGAIAGFAVTVVIGMALLIAGAVAAGWARAVLWTVAVAIDYAGPAWLTRERLRGLQEVAVAHFAERYGAFVIICLGESIAVVGVGIGVADRPLTPALTVAATLPLLVAIGMWWTYFDRTADAAQERLRVHDDPVLAAADSYSYLHLLIVGGIIIFAGGVKLVVHNSVSAPMPDPGRLAMCGGVALYLVGLAAFRLRILGERSISRVLVAVALLVLYAVSGSFPAWTVGALIAVLVLGLCALEAARGDIAGVVAEPAGAEGVESGSPGGIQQPPQVADHALREGPAPAEGRLGARRRPTGAEEPIRHSGGERIQQLRGDADRIVDDDGVE
jgi:low temperature requirement protein LtrA